MRRGEHEEKREIDKNICVGVEIRETEERAEDEMGERNKNKKRQEQIRERGT